MGKLPAHTARRKRIDPANGKDEHEEHSSDSEPKLKSKTAKTIAHKRCKNQFFSLRIKITTDL
jgi:hypothetical protein